MSRYERYGKIWEVDEDLGQPGLIDEDHYKALFSANHLEDSLRKSDNWLDIGANIGAFCVRASEYVNLIVAAEPEPNNVDALNTNIGLNECKNIVVEELAVVGDDRSSVHLALSNSYSSTHRVGKVRGRETIEVPAMGINELVDQYDINKIKCDCEGSELEIFQAIDWNPIDEVIFEYHFSFIRDRPWVHYFNILETLEKEGFDILRGPRKESKSWHAIVWAKRP